MNIWKKLEKYPPVLVRLLAKNEDGTAMSDGDVVRVSGYLLNIAEVRRLSYLTIWDNVAIADMRRFCIACGVDFGNRNRMRTLNRYLKDAKFSHLTRHKDFPAFKEMLKVYLNSQIKHASQ